MEASEDFSTFQLGFGCLIHVLIDSRVECLALREFFFTLGIQFAYLLHQVLLLDLQSLVLFDQVIEV